MRLGHSDAVRVHVVTAHPVPDSFNAAIVATALAALRRAGHAVDHLDLYAEQFDPVLSDAERRVYHDAGANLVGIEDWVARLRAAEALVIAAPTWWYGMPAILKGYFDRVWAPGVAFHMPPPGGGAIRGGLANIRAFAVLTTYGSPWWFIRLVMRDPGRRVLTTGLRRLFAPGARVRYLARYGMDNCPPARRAEFLARVERAMARL